MKRIADGPGLYGCRPRERSLFLKGKAVSFGVVRGMAMRQTGGMKTVPRLLILVVLACSLSACLFKEPVFTEGFVKVDASLAGVWATEDERGDPRKIWFAVCAPLDDDRQILHYAEADKNGFYFEVRALKIRDRSLLQLRMLASFGGGVPKPDAERFTLVWIEKEAGGQSLRMRSLGGDGVKEKGAAGIRKELETPSSDWSKLFGEPVVFRRLKDR